MKAVEHLLEVVLKMLASGELVLVVAMAAEEALVLLDRTPSMMMMMMMILGEPQLSAVRRRHFCTERLPEVVLKIQAAYGELVLVAAMAAAALRLLAENPPSPSIYPVPTGMYRRRRRRQIYPSSNRRCLGL